MNISQSLEKLTSLHDEITRFGKFPEEIRRKIINKFRLDWNYYSNRMEGGTLTREETRSIMIGNITVQGKPLKDVVEMNGHDEVVREILRMGKGEVRISERRIKEIHKAIIAETENLESNEEIGAWKTRPNEIINYKGEKITFTAPADVPDAIHNLLNKTNAELDAFFSGRKTAKHPVIIATDFHLGFVSIHPFFDGNGRVGRILLNLILISCGYPPIIIRDTDKTAYYQYLADIQAYGGSKDFLHSQMINLLEQSLLLVLKAIKGVSIEEDDDLEKKISLLDQKIRGNVDYSDIPEKSSSLVLEVIDSNIFPLIHKIQNKLIRTNNWFSENYVRLYVDGNEKWKGANLPENIQDVVSDLEWEKVMELEIFMHFERLKLSTSRIINKKLGLSVHFDSHNYHITYGIKQETKSFNYLKIKDDEFQSATAHMLADAFLEDLQNELEDKEPRQDSNQ